MASVYRVNKGINASFEFKGLRAQYIIYLIVGLAGLLFTFAVLYMLGVALYITLPAIAGLGGVMVSQVYRMSRKYGANGLAKAQAYKLIPTLITCHKRIFKAQAGKL